MILTFFTAWFLLVNLALHFLSIYLGLEKYVASKCQIIIIIIFYCNIACQNRKCEVGLTLCFYFNQKG